VFIRYRRDKSGAPVAHALVYTEKEHGIDKRKIDPDAIRIIERLKNAGHQAYIVGGAVRDLVQGKTPKDFDLATDAIPAKIKKLFRNARIIGKRFRLVHIFFGPKIIEVSTFRSTVNGSVGNEFGTIDEDVMRRDFSFNALYYDPTDQVLVDFVGGLKDLRAGKLKPVIPLSRIFKEDPVRIVRGIKYASASDFLIPLAVRLTMKKEAHLLADVSHSRMTEEFFKILASGKSEPILKAMSEYKLLGYFVPSVWAKMKEDLSYSKQLFADLKALDDLHLDVSSNEIERPDDDSSTKGKQKLSVLLSYFLKSWLESMGETRGEPHEAFREALMSARSFIEPLNPPRVELEAAVLMVFRASGLSPLQKPPRARRRRRSAPRTGDAGSAAAGGGDTPKAPPEGGGGPGARPDDKPAAVP
jgi:poly(A) polymerase